MIKDILTGVAIFVFLGGLWLIRAELRNSNYRNAQIRIIEACNDAGGLAHVTPDLITCARGAKED